MADLLRLTVDLYSFVQFYFAQMKYNTGFIKSWIKSKVCLNNIPGRPRLRPSKTEGNFREMQILT